MLVQQLLLVHTAIFYFIMVMSLFICFFHFFYSSMMIFCFFFVVVVVVLFVTFLIRLRIRSLYFHSQAKNPPHHRCIHSFIHPQSSSDSPAFASPSFRPYSAQANKQGKRTNEMSKRKVSRSQTLLNSIVFFFNENSNRSKRSNIIHIYVAHAKLIACKCCGHITKVANCSLADKVCYFIMHSQNKEEIIELETLTDEL